MPPYFPSLPLNDLQIDSTVLEQEDSRWSPKNKNVYNQYDEEVYSIMATPQKREHILQHIQEGEDVLIIGCGPTAYLERAILHTKKNVQLLTTDYDLEMILQSKRKVSNVRLHHRLSDMRTLSKDFSSQFDRVISTNSMVLPQREDIVKTYQEIAKVLKGKGTFLAFLPSFDFICEVYEKYPRLQPLLDTFIDFNDARFHDTTGFQSFHTQENIYREIGNAGMKVSYLEKIGVESNEEFSQLVKIYSILAGELTKEIIKKFWEYFLISEKSTSSAEIKTTLLSSEVQLYTSETISPDQVKEISDFYRFIFDNMNAQHFLVDVDTGEFKSPQEVFPSEVQDEYGCIPQLMRDGINQTDIPLSSSGNPMMRWHDPEQTFNVFLDRYQKGGFTFVQKGENNRITGALSFFQSSLKEIFKKSWEDPLEYSSYAGKKTEQFRLFDDFYNRTKSVYPEITLEDEVICLDFIALHPQFQKENKLAYLLRSAVQELSTKSPDIYLIAESKVGAPSHKLFKKRCEFKPISGFLTQGASEQEGDDVLEITTVGDFCKGLQFLVSKK